MPDEPNKKMDEMLRAYAEERRKAPDLPLHPATRNLLQGEVKRVFGHAPEPRPWWKRLRAFWPQLAFGGSLCLILGVAVLSLRQPPATTQESAAEAGVELTGNAVSTDQKKTEETEALKRQQPSLIASEADRAAPQGAAASPENRGLKPAHDLADSQTRSVNRTVRSAPKNEPDSITQPVAQRNEPAATTGREATLAEATASSEIVLSKEKVEARQPEPKPSSRFNSSTARAILRSESDEAKNLNAKAPVSTRALPTPTKLTRTAELTNLGAARRLSFVQVTVTNTRPGAAASATSPVLTSFQVEQFGTNVRFLDRDGSVYVGVLDTTNALAVSERKDDAAQVANSANYFFRVQGTNRTSGTELLFIGQYFEQTNAAPNSLDTFAIAPGAAPRPTNQARHLIIGNATLGATNVPVRAVSREQ
ncbi:MAG: hypothetical protein ACXW3Z_12650 [Limisphaerales bacterium]